MTVSVFTRRAKPSPATINVVLFMSLIDQTHIDYVDPRIHHCSTDMTGTVGPGAVYCIQIFL